MRAAAFDHIAAASVHCLQPPGRFFTPRGVPRCQKSRISWPDGL